MNELRKISVRELQHNLSDYLELAKATPLSVTKYGERQILLVNPEKYNLVEKEKLTEQKKSLLDMAFIGMHKNKFRSKSSAELAKDLRAKAWQGEIE